MVDALLNWREDLHTCGRPLSESLHDPDKSPDEQIEYVVGVETCRACQALDKFHAQKAEDPNEKKLREAGRNPDSWRLPTVMPASEAAALVASGQAAER